MSEIPDISSCTAAILAGGLGTRLRSVISDRPKPMAEVNGRPFITYVLDQLIDAGIKRAVICTGYLGEKVKTSLGHHWRALQLSYSQEKVRLGTAGALRLAAPQIPSDNVLVMNGDSYLSANLQEFWIWRHIHLVQASMVLAQAPDTRQFGRIQVDENSGRILKFEEKGNIQGAGWINAGIYLLPKSMLEVIPANQEVSLEKDCLPKWITMGFYGYQSQGRFLDIGLPETYAIASNFFTGGAT